MRSQSLFNFLTKAADVTQTPAGTRIHRGSSAAAANSSAAAAGKQAVDSARKLKMADRGGAGASTRAGANGSGARAGAGAQGGAPQMPTQTPTPNDAERAATLRWGPFGGGQQGNGGGTQTHQPAPGANAEGQGGTQTGPTNNGTPAAASKPSPITFKGGYTVGGVNGNIDWAAKGDGSINVGGAQLTAEQYNAFNNVRSSLANQLRQQDGLSHTEARARATQMANQWMADQTAVANGGKALNKWQDNNLQSTSTGQGPATGQGQPTGQGQGQPAGPTTGPATGQGQGQPAEQGPRPIDTTSSWGEGAAEQPTGENPNTPPGGSGEGAGTQTGTTDPTAQPAANQYADKVWSQQEIADALHKQKTQVASGLTAIPGYDGLLFRKDGDASGGVYDRTGKQLTYQGKAINDKLLQGDRTKWFEFWKDGDYGVDILHNAHQAMQSRATSNYGDAEMKALGFTRVPNSRRWYKNAKGQFVDISGELAPEGTMQGQLNGSRTWGQRWKKDTWDPMGLFFDGEREDIGRK